MVSGADRRGAKRQRRQKPGQPSTRTRNGPVRGLRLDKWLKASRLIKRRKYATDMCWSGMVRLNGRVVNPSRILRVGDVVEIEQGDRSIKVEVLRLFERRATERAVDMYSVLGEDFHPEPEVDEEYWELQPRPRFWIEDPRR